MNATRLVSFALTAVGLAVAAHAVQLSLWANGEPAAGLFPFVAALLMIGTSLACTRETLPAAEPVQFPRLLAYCATLALFCLLLELIGFALAAFLFLATVLALIERMRWKTAILLAAAFAFSTWGLFEGLLSVPLPRGEWGL